MPSAHIKHYRSFSSAPYVITTFALQFMCGQFFDFIFEYIYLYISNIALAYLECIICFILNRPLYLPSYDILRSTLDQLDKNCNKSPL